MDESRMESIRRVGGQHIQSGKDEAVDKSTKDSYNSHMTKLQGALKKPLTKDRHANGETAQVWLKNITDLKRLSENATFSPEMKHEFKTVMGSLKESGLDTSLSSEAFASHYNEVSREEKIEHLSKWQKQEEFAPTAFSGAGSSVEDDDAVGISAAAARSGRGSRTQSPPASSPRVSGVSARAQASAARASARVKGGGVFPDKMTLRQRFQVEFLGAVNKKITAKMKGFNQNIKNVRQAQRAFTSAQGIQNRININAPAFPYPIPKDFDLGIVKNPDGTRTFTNARALLNHYKTRFKDSKDDMELLDRIERSITRVEKEADDSKLGDVRNSLFQFWRVKTDPNCKDDKVMIRVWHSEGNHWSDLNIKPRQSDREGMIQNEIAIKAWAQNYGKIRLIQRLSQDKDAQRELKELFDSIPALLLLFPPDENGKEHPIAASLNALMKTLKDVSGGGRDFGNPANLEAILHRWLSPDHDGGMASKVQPILTSALLNASQINDEQTSYLHESLSVYEAWHKTAIQGIETIAAMMKKFIEKMG